MVVAVWVLEAESMVGVAWMLEVDEFDVGGGRVARWRWASWMVGAQHVCKSCAGGVPLIYHSKAAPVLGGVWARVEASVVR